MSHPAGALRVAGWAFLISFVALLANGRAIGSGDTHAVERTAGTLAQSGSFVLPSDDAHDPFTRPVPGGRVSIYPALTALMAAPIFFIFSLFFDLTPAGLQIAGRLSAALFAATAVSLMAWSYARRVSPARGLVAALLFGLSTSVFSTAQALWQHPVVLLLLVASLIITERAVTTHRANRPGLVTAAALLVSLAAAARPATIPMCGVLLLFIVSSAPEFRWPIVAAASIPAIFVAAYNATFFGAPWHFGPGLGGRFFSALPESVGGLLVSPGRGLLVFTPVALVALAGLVAAARAGRLARALLLAVAVHFLFITSWNEWHGGESYGPRLLTDLLPALFFFLPEGLAAWPVLGAGLGVLSIGIQALGGWTYDYRWERLYQRGQDFDAALWNWSDSPLAFAIREGVLIQGTPRLDGRRLTLPLSRSTPFGPMGSVVEGTNAGLRVRGEPLIRDIRLERGGRVSESWIRLTHPGDALAFRSTIAGTPSLHLVGSLQGILKVETGSRSKALTLTGDFDVLVPLELTSGDEVFIRAAAGDLKLARAELASNASGS